MKVTTRRVALSVETTRTTYKGGAQTLIELAAVEFFDAKLTGRILHHYVKPAGALASEVMKRTGLTSQFLDDKPLFEQIAGDVIEFLEGADIVLFDAASAVAVLNAELQRSDKRALSQVARSISDVQSIAMQRNPDADNSFPSLCTRYFVSGGGGLRRC